LTLSEYARSDALGLARLVATGQVSPKELALVAAQAIEAVNPTVNAVVETYPDRIEGLDEKTLGPGPFRGVPFLMKDVFGHEAGRRIEFGSRLCRGMIAQADTHLCELFKASGLNILGRSATPEYSMSGTTESVMFGKTSTPWKHGYSAGGSTGGGMAAVMAGMVPIAHGSDIAGSIRIPRASAVEWASSRRAGRVSFGRWSTRTATASDRTSCSRRACATRRRCSTAWRFRRSGIRFRSRSPRNPMPRSRR
jgi:amidase